MVEKIPVGFVVLKDNGKALRTGGYKATAKAYTTRGKAQAQATIRGGEEKGYRVHEAFVEVSNEG